MAKYGKPVILIVSRQKQTRHQMTYQTSEFLQLFKSTLNDRVLMLEVTEQSNFKLYDGMEMSMKEMINTYWTPIEFSSYIGSEPVVL